jgi:hypothetical protein
MESYIPNSLPIPFGSLDLESFYITRVLENVALVKVGVVGDLRSAEVLMRRTARRIPGAYLIFNGRTRRVVRKLVRAAKG